tara:strand:- start:331 stop:708 length:378 start_codon:yes stop_codon:yes gene_type:complete
LSKQERQENQEKQRVIPIDAQVKPRRNARGQWIAGQSGNPSGLFQTGNTASLGHGRRNSVSNLLNRLGDTSTDEGTLREQLAAKLYQMALKGDINAIKVCLERMDGRVREELHVTEVVTDEVVIR